MGRKGTFTDRVRQVLIGENGGEIEAADIASKLDLDYGQKHMRPLYNALRELVRQGEAERVQAGTYRSIRRTGKKPELQQVMWRFLRVRRTVCADDLQEISGASRDYALEWLRMLEKHGVVQTFERDHTAMFRLIKDTIDMPANDEKKARLKRIRQAKRELLASLTAVEFAVQRARVIAQEMEVDNG
uniref:Putative transcriptional regulator n=1 Tax=viral metagenome TaxID=1070528 RepID=A0A6M3KS64_9ZZZZ